ncbi:MAG TPA: cytochrome-c peroxidase [Halieaceae bacterium]|nr:cytochrome-c peroxidase [Halieaceae bacterium]
MEPCRPRLLAALVLLLVMPLAPLLALPAVAEDFRLSDQCPPGFEQLGGDVCRLATLYDQYGSLRGRGVGGTRTGLPPRRDGFTAQQIDLGRYLFFDPLLSADGSLSCASCHDPALGFADGRGRSTGLHGEALPRGAPTLWNSAFLQHFFWDARADSLEAQLTGPLYAPEEMGNNPADLLAALRGNDAYPVLFRAAFGDDSGPIDTAQVYAALAAFEASLVSLNSRYDRYAHGDHSALDAEEIAGLNVFRSFVARCAECHTPPLFTNQQVAVIGSPEPPGLARDIGAEATLGSPKLRGAFKVPTLRNIARTAPYMHSGRFETLDEVVTFYNGGRGHAVPEGEALQLHWHIVSPDLADHELEQLVAFLGTLTDERFLPRVPTQVPSGLAVGGRSAREAPTPTGDAP